MTSATRDRLRHSIAMYEAELDEYTSSLHEYREQRGAELPTIVSELEALEPELARLEGLVAEHERRQYGDAP